MSARMNRREFVKASAVSAAGLALASKGSMGAGLFGAAPGRIAAAGAGTTRVVLVHTKDRAAGVAEILKRLDFPSPKGKSVILKPNFNTADPAPGSTHNDTLRRYILEMKERGAAKVTIGERSGPPNTRQVMQDKGVFDVARETGAEILNFEELADADWAWSNPPGSHWSKGFAVPRAVAESDYIVSTGCLKTHQYGGVFTMSLKLSVGMTPKSLMREMHGNKEHMRRMIAEIGTAWRPKVAIIDGVEAFVDGGPSEGKKVDAGVMFGGTDRVAVDAVGVAVLKALGSNAAIMGKPIFQQEQIARAIELGLGIDGPGKIELVSFGGGADAEAFTKKVRAELAKG